MGRADDKEGEALLSEADDEKEKDDSDKDTSDIDDPDVESKKKYKCTEPGCTARFLRPSRLTWHLRKHNDERPYKCSIEGCTRAYTNSSHLKRHENTHKPVTKTYTCNECLLEVGSLFSLKRHRKMIHDPKRLTCTECGAKFRKKHCYNEHLSMHAGISMYKCNVCQLDYPTLRLLKKHQHSHDKQKVYPCKSPGCKEVFDKWSKLGKHVEKEHQFDHECDKCDKRFKLRRHLADHMTLHDKSNIFLACPHKNCPKFYLHRKNLDEHVDTYHQGRRFYCDMCNVAVTSKASIVRHINSFHSAPREPQQKKKNPRRRRKDTGKAKRSMAVKLSGLKVPYELEKAILRRRPRIDLERLKEPEVTTEENPHKEATIGIDPVTQSFVSMDEAKSATKSSSVIDPTMTTDEQIHPQAPPVCPPEQTEAEILSSADSLLLFGKLIVLEKDGESESEENNEKLSILADQLLQNDEANDVISLLTSELTKPTKFDIPAEPFEEPSQVPMEETVLASTGHSETDDAD